MVEYGKSCRSSRAKSVWSSCGWTCEKSHVSKYFCSTVGKRFPIVRFRAPWKRVILICVCGWHKIGWKETKPWSGVESTKQRSWFGRTNIFPWSCEIRNDIKDNYRVMFESRTTNRTTQQLHKVSTPCIDDHHFKEEETKFVGKFSQVCFQIVLKCLCLAWIGRPDILWSVTKFARSITKWTKACDKRLNRLISYIHHTCEYKQYCYVGNTAEQCRLGLFRTLIFREILKIQHPLLEERTSCWLAVIHLFQKFRCVRNKHQFLTKKSEIISLETGWFSCPGIMGSNCYCFWKYFSCFRRHGATRKWEKQIWK